MSRIVFVVVVVALIVIAYRSSIPRDDAAVSNQGQGDGRAPVGTIDIANVPDLSFLLTQVPPRVIPTPHPEGIWVERVRLTGTENARSDAFDLSGNLARLRYTLDGNVTILALSVIPDSPGGFGGFPDVMATRLGEAERLLARSAGRYRLVVQSTGGNWTAAIEEEELPKMDDE